MAAFGRPIRLPPFFSMRQGTLAFGSETSERRLSAVLSSSKGNRRRIAALLRHRKSSERGHIHTAWSRYVASLLLDRRSRSILNR